MSDSSESRRPYDYPQSEEEEEEVVAESSHDLNYRKFAASSGGVATAMHHFSERQFGFGPHDPPEFESETSGESIPPSWAGATSGSTESSRFIPPGKARGGYSFACAPVPSRTPAKHSPTSYEYASHHQQGPYGGQPSQQIQHPTAGGGSFNPMMSGVSGVTDDEPLGFANPFGSAGKSAVGGSSAYDDDSDAPRAIPFPSTFRLERTNFVVSPVPGSCTGRRLDVQLLVGALRSVLSAVGVDVLDFKPAHCVLECSSHVGNRFLSIFIRVFRAPDRASGQLFESPTDAYSRDNVYRGQGEDQDTPFLVEAQLREGDRLHFSALFREMMREFKNQEGVHLAGTFCYKRRAYPAVGEGLALEEASLKPSRGSFRLLAERKETLQAGGNAPPAGRFGAGWGAMGASSPPPVPPGMAKTPAEGDEGFDEDMNEDVMVLTKMLRGSYLDVQADAATAVAGLTAKTEFLRQFCRDEASQAASALCSASARLLVETTHRPARRQAAVVVANLSSAIKLRAKLLASDPPLMAHTPVPVGSLNPRPQERRLVESLVVLAMGMRGGDGGAMAGTKEEEIGMRRECMRALVGLAECEEVRKTHAIRLLLSYEPSGRGAKDSTLVKRLGECRAVLKTRL